MNFIDMIKDKMSNKVILKFTVHPPLSIFSNADLTPLFKTNWDSTVTSVTFNNQSS